MDYGFLNDVPGALPKPTPRDKVKAKEDRTEASIKRKVRARCVERDGDCRICDWENNPDDTHEGDGGSDDLPYPDKFSDSRSEWAHLERSKRARTRGMKPELRHTTAMSVMLCRFHHRLYDAGKLLVTLLSNLGADGPLGWRNK